MNAYEAKQEARRERLLAAAEKADRLSASMYRAAKRAAEAIPFGQPIMVGHHSEKRDRNYRARFNRQYERSFELSNKAKYLRGVAESVGKAGISSDDPEAPDKLKEKVEKLKQTQARMKAANMAIRFNKKKGQPDQVAALVALGFTASQALKLLEPDFCGRIGFPDYALTNNNANIRRIEARIQTLEARPTESVEREIPNGITYREDAEENRVMLTFPGKPDQAARTVLKSHGFRWSPTRGAWVRFLNGSGKAAAQAVIDRLTPHATCTPEIGAFIDPAGVLQKAGLLTVVKTS